MDAARPRGRPPVQRDEGVARQVKLLAGMGTPQEGIAVIVGMARHTLTKLYTPELEMGGIEANAAVAKSLFQMATGSAGKKPNVVAALFWLKARAGWREEGDEPGKKEAAALLGRVAERGTSWDGLLSDGGAS